MGINRSRGIYGSMAGTSRTSNTYVSRRTGIPKQQQKAEKKAAAGKIILTLAAIAAAIKFRKPIGKVLQPITNKISTKFPTASNAARAVKGRAGRIFNKMRTNFSKWFTNSAKPTVDKVAQDTVEFTRKKAAPAVKKAAEDTVIFTREKVVPTVNKKAKSFLNKVAQAANSDLPKL